MKRTFQQFIVKDVFMNVKKVVEVKKNKKGMPIGQFVNRVRYINYLGVLKDKMYTKVGTLQCVAYVSSEPLPFEKRFEGKEMPLSVGKAYAKEVFDCAWLHITGKMPEGYRENDLVFLIDTAGEGLVFDKTGKVKQGITTFASQFSYDLGMPEKRVVRTDGLVENGDIDFYIDCGANDLFGNLKKAGQIQQLDISVPNKEIIALYYDLEVLLSVYDNNKNGEYIEKLYSSLREVLRLLPSVTDENASTLRAKLATFLETQNDEEVFSYSAIGHAHLDLAWLWPIRESIRKGGRTFSNQLLNIRLFDGYVFGDSQAQLYQWVKDNYPDVYENVKKAVEDKRWEVQGATWVEMDSNLTSGESLVRQFLYGKKYFREEFGLDMKILWLPDSFGYSACLPQLMEQAEVPYFLTQKMSWNTVNKFPYHTFQWVGLDGTKVLAHMLPEDTYNGPATGDRAVFGEKNYRERKVSDEAVSLFGIGDGGAGPGFDHIERATRMNDVKGLPKYKFGFAVDYFSRLEKGKEKYPVYQGELYLEKHQGTYTTRVRNKKYNRRMEFTLQNYEKVAVIAKERGIALPIEKEELETIWKEVLLYQFHDILPGSSINRVYDETDARYPVLLERVQKATEKLLTEITAGKTVVNFNSFAYEFPLKEGEKWYRCRLPQAGFAPLGEEITTFSATCGIDCIENDRVKITFNNGLITSLFDKENQRECIGKGKANQFTEYGDLGDCWDFRPRNYKSKKSHATLCSFQTGVEGAKAFALLSYAIEGTTVEQQVYILDGSPLVYFETKINRKAKAKDLRVALPLSVKCNEASFNIQFGHLKRKTTEENSIEKAQFEVSGQKFVDLSEDSFGVTVITDCKYGYRVKNGTVDICLVRSPLNGPGKNVDQGESTLVYALYPHKGSLSEESYKQAYFINNPPVVVGEGEGREEEFFRSSDPSILLETVKFAEEGESIIARLYNCSEEGKEAELSFKGYRIAEKVNILEKTMATHSQKVKMHGFELLCLRLIKE